MPLQPLIRKAPPQTTCLAITLQSALLIGAHRGFTAVCLQGDLTVARQFRMELGSDVPRKAVPECAYARSGGGLCQDHASLYCCVVTF